MLAASSYTQQPQLAFSVDRGTWVAAGDVPPEPAILPAPSARASPPRRALSTPFADLNPAQVRSVAGDVADILFHVDALRDADSIEAVVDAAGALADLCSTSRAGAAGAEAMRHAIANADAIPALVELLELQAQPRVPAQAAWTLASLMYGSPSNRESAVVAGAAPRLVALLTVGKEPTAPSGTAEEAAYALKIMCWQHPPSKDAVVDAGGVAALIRLLALSRHENTLLHACGALANLAVERAHRRRTVEEGGVPPLLQLLSSKRQLVLQEAAALAVKALAWEEEDNKRALRRAGAVKRLVRLLERKPEHAIVSASSELPEGWSQHWTPDGRPYYKEHATGSTHWQPPAAIAPTLQRAQRRLAAAQLAAVQALLNLSYEKGRGRRALISANAPPSLRRLLAAPTSSDELSGAAAVLLKRLGYREGMDGDGETLPAPVAEPRPATAAPPSAGLAGGYKPVHAPGLPPAPSAARPWTAPAPAAEPAKVAKKKKSKKAAHAVPTVPDEAYGELRDGVRRIEESIEALRAELQARTVVTTADMSTAPAPAPEPEPEPEPAPALASKEKPLAADAAAGSFAAFLAANESGEGSQDQEEVLEVSVGSGGLDIGSDISISADSPRPAPSQDQEEEEEEVLEISAGALSLGSEISLSEGDSGTVKDTGLAPAPASTAGSDVISFEGSDLDIGEGDMEIELSTGGADEPARSEEEPRAFSRAGPSPVAAPAPEPEPQVDEADLVRRMIDEPGTLSRAEEDSGLTYKREFISQVHRLFLRILLASPTDDRCAVVGTGTSSVGRMSCRAVAERISCGRIASTAMLSRSAKPATRRCASAAVHLQVPHAICA